MNGKSPRLWPFWILIAAWVCANTPAGVICGVIQWTEGAAHFSHQGQLESDVALILRGRETPGVFAFLKSTSLARPALPAVPPDTLTKKIDLYAPSAGWSATLPLREQIYSESNGRIPAARQDAPLYEPPRAPMTA